MQHIFVVLIHRHPDRCYRCSASRCGRVSQGELRKSNLVEVFNTVDEEEDINKVNSVAKLKNFAFASCA